MIAPVLQDESLTSSPAFWVFAGLLVTQLAALVGQWVTERSRATARREDLQETRDAREAVALEARETRAEHREAAERARAAAVEAALAATGAVEAATAAAAAADKARTTSEKIEVKTDKIEVLVNNKSDVAQRTIERLTEEIKELNRQALAKAESSAPTPVTKLEPDQER